MTTTVLTLVFVLLMVGAYFLTRNKRTTLSLPNIITTLGILGTFVGICYGLMHFDVQDIQASVPRLLEGLKTAFLTSVFGMVFSIVLRLYPSLYIPVSHDEKKKVEGATLDDVVTALEKATAVQTRIQTALVGQEDGTLLTQLQKLRTTLCDKQDELIGQFRAFAATMAKANSDALIEALRDVIRDFNVKLNEQFGDNFKELNRAVGQLLTWQENYRQHVEQTTQRLKEVLEAARHCEHVLESLGGQQQAFHRTATSLEAILGVLDGQTKAMEAHLTSFAGVASQAQSAVPELARRVDQLTRDFSDAVKRSAEQSAAALEHQLDSFSRLSDIAQKSMDAQSRALKESHSSAQQELERIIAGVRVELTRGLAEMRETMAKQVRALDEELGQELNKALQTLGSQLASLSQKFVQDYGPLTERLRDIVALSRGVDHA